MLVCCGAGSSQEARTIKHDITDNIRVFDTDELLQDRLGSILVSDEGD